MDLMCPQIPPLIVHYIGQGFIFHVPGRWMSREKMKHLINGFVTKFDVTQKTMDSLSMQVMYFNFTESYIFVQYDSLLMQFFPL